MEDENTYTCNLTIEPVLQPNGKYLLEIDATQLLHIKNGLSLLEQRRQNARKYYRKKKEENGGNIKPRMSTKVTLNIIRPDAK